MLVARMKVQESCWPQFLLCSPGCAIPRLSWCPHSWARPAWWPAWSCLFVFPMDAFLRRGFVFQSGIQTCSVRLPAGWTGMLACRWLQLSSPFPLPSPPCCLPLPFPGMEKKSRLSSWAESGEGAGKGTAPEAMGARPSGQGTSAAGRRQDFWLRWKGYKGAPGGRWLQCPNQGIHLKTG